MKILSIEKANLDFTFELVSPYNQIVKYYPEPTLYLIGGRDKYNEFKELLFNQIYKEFDTELKNLIKIPEIYPIIDQNTGKFRGFEELKMFANNCPNPTDEGFVVVDYSSYNDEFGYFPRVKVKNSSYVALHHLRGTIDNGAMNYGSILEIIWKNEQDEVLASFNQFKNFFDEVEIKYKKFIEEFSAALNDVAFFFLIPVDKRADKETKKAFALAINKKFSGFLFSMFNKGLNFKEMVELEAAKNKSYFKKFWEDYISKY